MVLPDGFALPPLSYLLPLLLVVVAVIWSLRRAEPTISERTIVSLAPWMVVGAGLNALYQVPGTPIPDVKLATGKKVTEILEDNDAEPELPEDFRNLLEKAVRLQEHVDENGQDHQNKRALQNTQSKIRRLADYYRGDELDEDFTYSHERAKELLE